MMETQMILREALQTPIGAKLKFSQFGFIPTPNAKNWIKIPNYHFKTKEKVRLFSDAAYLRPFLAGNPRFSKFSILNISDTTNNMLHIIRTFLDG